MLIEIYILLQVVVVALFLLSFFTHQELLWVITIVSSALLMFSSYNIEKLVPVYNATITGYESVIVSYSYPYMMGFNALFFGLSLILVFFDMFDKYKNRKSEE